MFGFAIPLIASIASGLFHHKQPGAPTFNPDGGGETDGGGFHWGQAAPWLGTAAAAIAAGAAMHHGQKQPDAMTSGPLADLLRMQLSRYNQTEPLRQLLINQQASMLPTYMQHDPGFQQWQQSYGHSAMPTAVPRR